MSLLDDLTEGGFKLRVEGDCMAIYFCEKQIGKLRKNRFYTFREVKDKFNIFDGFGFNEDLIKLLVKHQINDIVLQWNDKLFKTDPKTVLKKGTNYKHQDYEQQIVLKEIEMEEV